MMLRSIAIADGRLVSPKVIFPIKIMQLMNEMLLDHDYSVLLRTKVPKDYICRLSRNA